MSGDDRLERLRKLVAQLEALPGSDERDRVLGEVRARAVDLDTGVTPRAMLRVDRTGIADIRTPERRAAPPAQVKAVPAAPAVRPAPPSWSPSPLQVPASAIHAIDLLAADERLCLEEPLAEQAAHRPWQRGLRG